MSRTHQVATALGFTFFLVLIGTADALLTGDAMVLPTGSQSSSAAFAGPDVGDTVRDMGFETQNTGEESLLAAVLPTEVSVTAQVLLHQNDRVAYLAYADMENAKTYYFALKSTLHKAFSRDLHDLVDEQQNPEGKPLREVLTFRDGAIHPDRLVFVRVWSRIYELHVAEGKEELVNGLLVRLTE